MTQNFIAASVVAGLAILSTAGFTMAGGTTAPPDPISFTRDVAPILYSQCAACHRPGEVAPFSLLSYSEAQARDGDRRADGFPGDAPVEGGAWVRRFRRRPPAH